MLGIKKKKNKMYYGGSLTTGGGVGEPYLDRHDFLKAKGPSFGEWTLGI